MFLNFRHSKNISDRIISTYIMYGIHCVHEKTITLDNVS